MKIAQSGISKSILLIILVTTYACSPSTGNKGSAGDEEIVTYFAEAILKSDADAALRLTSSRFQSRMTRDQFARPIEDAISKYGIPSQFEIDFNTTDPQTTQSEIQTFDPPVNFPIASARTWGYITFSGIGCFDLFFITVDDQGEPRIGHFYIEPCD